MIKVFVYGTLKPGETYHHTYCIGQVVKPIRAIALGQLYDLSVGYPAMTSGDSPVHGYILSFADERVFQDLDELEAYHPAQAASDNVYHRQQIETYDLQGRSLGWAWVYLMTTEKVQQLGGVLLADGWWSGCGLERVDI